MVKTKEIEKQLDRSAVYNKIRNWKELRGESTRASMNNSLSE